MSSTKSGEKSTGQDTTMIDVSRRDFLKAGTVAGGVTAVGLGGFYFGYNTAVGSPVRIAVIGTGDEGSVLIGALNPKFHQVVAISDIRPYSRYRAFHGEVDQPVRPGLMSIYGWKTEAEAKRHVKVYERYEELIRNAKRDGVEAVVIALPLHLHAPAAIAAMQAGLHVLTEKLMGHSVARCKEMARVARDTKLHLATGHQRHYNIKYAQAMDHIRRGHLGDLHYIRAMWHRNNLPAKDCWKQPLPPGVKDEKSDPRDYKASQALAKNLAEAKKQRDMASGKELLTWMKKVAQLEAQIEDALLHKTKDESGKSLVEALGYEAAQYKDAEGKVVYDRPAIEELIRWRLWDRTGAGLMAELGSHQLDAASIFLSAMHEGKKPHPLNVIAAANRPIFPVDRDIEDHVFCVIEFPAPGYDARDKQASRKKVSVQYASINGNGFGGYGEIVYGTKGTLLLEQEKTLTLLRDESAASSVKMMAAGSAPTMDTQASGPAQKAVAAGGEEVVSRGYSEELEHWAWCIRNPAKENKPRCYPEVAMGDAVIALTTNMAARKGERIEFKEEWFDVDSDETPDGEKPDLSQYKPV